MELLVLTIMWMVYVIAKFAIREHYKGIENISIINKTVSSGSALVICAFSFIYGFLSSIMTMTWAIIAWGIYSAIVGISIMNGFWILILSILLGVGLFTSLFILNTVHDMIFVSRISLLIMYDRILL